MIRLAGFSTFIPGPGLLPDELTQVEKCHRLKGLFLWVKQSRYVIGIYSACQVHLEVNLLYNSKSEGNAIGLLLQCMWRRQKNTILRK